MQNKLQTLAEPRPYPAYIPWLMWGLGALLFFSEYFGRVAPSAMVPELMRDFGITALGASVLSTPFYLAYVGMQVPAGMLVDRFGSRYLLSGTSVFFALGCLVFAVASDIMIAQLGRLLMGLGAAFAMVATLRLAMNWFPANRFGLLATLTQALGMLGASTVGTMAVSVGAFGWRPTMLIIGLFFIAFGAIIYFIVRDYPSEQARQQQTQQMVSYNLWDSFLLVIKNRQNWLNGCYAGLLYAPAAVLGELWGPLFVEVSYDVGRAQATYGCGLIFIGFAIGAPLFGWFSDYIKNRKQVMFVSALGCFILLSIIIYAPNLPITVLFTLFFFYGIFCPGVALSYAVASEINPTSIAGTGMAFANMASILIGALLMQPLFGWLMDKSWDGTIINNIPVYLPKDFSLAMAILPLSLIVSMILLFFLRETHCKRL